MNSRTEQEYRALIRGWRIRLKSSLSEISTEMFIPPLRKITDILDEMEKEVPDYVPKEATENLKENPTNE